MDWFLYDNGLRHERVKKSYIYKHQSSLWTKHWTDLYFAPARFLLTYMGERYHYGFGRSSKDLDHHNIFGSLDHDILLEENNQILIF